MKRHLLSVALALCLCGPAVAALDIGDPAPDFTLPAALGGKVYQFSLAEALKNGPVVLYFFPAAFSEACSIEAHEFAEATQQFGALGATVVGISGDDIGTLTKFSVQACQSKFPVVSDEKHRVIKAYDAAMQTRPEYANRISYVIAPGGSVAYHYQNLDPTRHVQRMLAALKGWRDKIRK